MTAARDWILTETQAKLEITEAGSLPTPDGKVTFLDPLAFFQSPTWIDVPRSEGAVVVFHDVDEGRNSKLAIVFSDSPVTGGADVATCGVDAGMASIFHAADAYGDKPFLRRPPGRPV